MFLDVMLLDLTFSSNEIAFTLLLVFLLWFLDWNFVWVLQDYREESGICFCSF
jgi:hypothetical protein